MSRSFVEILISHITFWTAKTNKRHVFAEATCNLDDIPKKNVAANTAYFFLDVCIVIWKKNTSACVNECNQILIVWSSISWKQLNKYTRSRKTLLLLIKLLKQTWIGMTCKMWVFHQKIDAVPFNLYWQEVGMDPIENIFVDNEPHN